MTLNGGYSRLQNMDADYNVGLSLSVPLSLFDKTHYSFRMLTMIDVRGPV